MLIRTNTPLKRSFQRLFGLYAALYIRELENSFFGVTNRLVVGLRLWAGSALAERSSERKIR